MTKKQDAYNEALAEFIEAKAGNDPKAYAEAKKRLHKARAAWRSERDRHGLVEGTVVKPATVEAATSVNSPGG